MDKVSVDEVRERLSKGDGRVAIVDSRRGEAWDEAQTKGGGAIRIPPDEAEEHIADLSRDDYIVVYCT